MNGLLLALIVRLIKGLGTEGMHEYAVQLVDWFRKMAKESDNPVDDAVVEIVAAFLGVK